MDFGMMTGAYGARFSPYDYHTNGMMQGTGTAQEKDDAARPDDKESTLSSEDPRDAQQDEQGDATHDLRLKDDNERPSLDAGGVRDLQAAQVSGWFRRNGFVQSGWPY